MPSLELVQKVTFQTNPTFGVIKTIPPGFPRQIEGAVEDFIRSSHVPQGIDLKGLYFQSLEAIAAATHLGGSGDFYMGSYRDEIICYALAFVARDIDQKLAYHITQAWVRSDVRRNPIVKEWWEAMRQRAKDLFCKHIVITSSRNPKAYIRFLGHGMHEYCVMLKEEV